MTNNFMVTESVNGVDVTIGSLPDESVANQARRYLRCLDELSLKAQEKIKAKSKKEHLRMDRENIKKAKDERWAFILEDRAERKAVKEKIIQEKLAKKQSKEDREIKQKANRKAFAEKNGLI